MGDRSHYITPDFILSNHRHMEVTLNSRNAPELRVNRAFTEMFRAYDKGAKTDKNIHETAAFVKQKLDSAKWFIDAIRQRQNTLLRTMDAIVRYQREFFVEGDESKLRPMILKDIAQEISMDICTVSRVANSQIRADGVRHLSAQVLLLRRHCHRLGRGCQLAAR